VRFFVRRFNAFITPSELTHPESSKANASRPPNLIPIIGPGQPLKRDQTHQEMPEMPPHGQLSKNHAECYIDRDVMYPECKEMLFLPDMGKNVIATDDSFGESVWIMR
jgi:hypothetical protein